MALQRGGWLQLFSDKERAGSSSVTLAVDDIDATVRALKSKGVEISPINRNPQVDTAIAHDPDGNQIVIAKAKSGDMAR